jgi:hypothetical protein
VAEIPQPWGVTSGFSVEGGFGANNVTDDRFAVNVVEDHTLEPGEIGTLVGLYVGGFYRIIDYVSIGVSLQYAFLRPDFQAIDGDGAGHFGFLTEVRGYFPISRFDPWLSLGIGYALAFGTANGFIDNPMITGEYDGSISVRGVGIGFGVGANVYLTRRWALGFYVRLSFIAPTKACYRETYLSAGGDTNEDICNSPEIVYEDHIQVAEPEDNPHLWSAGLNVTYYFDFPRSSDEDIEDEFEDDGVEIVEDEEAFGELDDVIDEDYEEGEANDEEGEANDEEGEANDEEDESEEE